MSLRDEILPDLDELRDLANEFGLRRYSLTLRTRTWSGGQPGMGTPTDTDVVVDPPPKVRLLTTKEIADSGGTYQKGDFKVEKMTPRYTSPTAGGFSPAMLQIAPGGSAQDVAWVLTGDEGAIECTAIEFHFDKAFNYWMVLRARRSVSG